VEDDECGGVLVVKTGGREHVGDELPLRDVVGAREGRGSGGDL